MRILITGGAGFIGSHLVDAYLAQGHSVTIVDDLSGGAERLNPKARFYRLDIRSEALAEVFEKERPEMVSHHAARANVRESMDRPRLYADVNIIGSVNLLECSRKFGVGKFVFASTGGAVYGEPASNPVGEDHPAKPLDPYGAAKRAAEHYLRLYQTHYGIQCVTLRYPNVYGPRQDPAGEAGVVAIFAGRMITGKRPVIHGDGDQQRDFVYVSDIVQANLLAADSEKSGVYNIGTGEGTTVNQIFEILCRHTGYRGGADRASAKSGEVYRIFLDATRARRELGWRPDIRLEDGLVQTVRFYRRTLGARKT